MSAFQSCISSFPAIFILRRAESEGLERIVELLWDAGARLVEITLNTPNALAILEKLSGQCPQGCLLGAGTVRTVQEVKDAASVGVSFIVSPIADPALIDTTKELGLHSVPGAWSPSEVWQSWQRGADLIKVFPAQSPSYIAQLRGPFSEVPLAAVGGVRLTTAADFFAAGATAVGVGRNLLGIPETGEYEDSRIVASVKDLARVCPGAQV